MITIRLKNLLFFILIALLLNSCVTYESILSYENPPNVPDSPQPIANYQAIRIQPNDVLHIKINSLEQAAQPFELNSGGNTGAVANNPQTLLLNGYLVNQEGFIDFPTLGKLQLGGLTMEEAKTVLLEKLDRYFETPPIVNIRLLNFNVNVNGEVGAPGVISVQTERLTIVEAITMAGDFTDHSQRDSIMIVREADGERSFGYLDFNSPTIFESPYFYLQQNDVIYVRPLSRKVVTLRDPITRVLTYVSAGTGLAALVFTIINRR
ncbi:MAG: polysaccharide biosynthesis/export family protein [Bacteroidota bacterium]